MFSQGKGHIDWVYIYEVTRRWVGDKSFLSKFILSRDGPVKSTVTSNTHKKTTIAWNSGEKEKQDYLTPAAYATNVG